MIQPVKFLPLSTQHLHLAALDSSLIQHPCKLFSTAGGGGHKQTLATAEQGDKTKKKDALCHKQNTHNIFIECPRRRTHTVTQSGVETHSEGMDVVCWSVSALWPVKYSSLLLIKYQQASQPTSPALSLSLLIWLHLHPPLHPPQEPPLASSPSHE